MKDTQKGMEERRFIISRRVFAAEPNRLFSQWEFLVSYLRLSVGVSVESSIVMHV